MATLMISEIYDTRFIHHFFFKSCIYLVIQGPGEKTKVFTVSRSTSDEYHAYYASTTINFYLELL